MQGFDVRINLHLMKKNFALPLVILLGLVQVGFSARASGSASVRFSGSSLRQNGVAVSSAVAIGGGASASGRASLRYISPKCTSIVGTNTVAIVRRTCGEGAISGGTAWNIQRGFVSVYSLTQMLARTECYQAGTLARALYDARIC